MRIIEKDDGKYKPVSKTDRSKTAELALDSYLIRWKML